MFIHKLSPVPPDPNTVLYCSPLSERGKTRYREKGDLTKLPQQLVAEGWTRTFTRHYKAIPQVTPKPDMHFLSMAAEMLETKLWSVWLSNL